MNNNAQAQQIAAGSVSVVKPPSQVDMEQLRAEFRASKTYRDQYVRDFPALHTIVDALPLNSEDGTPFVADTTLAGLVRQAPRDSLKQMPVFSAVVNGTKKSITALLCTFFLKKYSFNEDTFGKGFLSTIQLGTEEAITQGYQPFIVTPDTMLNDFGTRLKMVHYSDTSPEPGIFDHNETGYDYVVAHLPESKVKKMYQRALNDPSSAWNAVELKRVLDSPTKVTEYSKYQSAAERNPNGENEARVYDFVTRYPVGTDETIITFCPDTSDAEEPLRELEIYSKFGYPRVMYLVIDPAALSPFGKSRVRLASPNVNLMNIYYGQVAAMLILNSAPPILKRGRFMSPVQLTRHAVWETLDPNATAELKNMDNGTLQFFPQMAAQFASQIQNIMGGKTVTATGNGKAGFGKTGPGERRAQEYDDSNTQQMTNIIENFIRQYAIVSLDTILSEQEGEDDIFVDDDTKEALNLVAPGTVGDDNVVHMVWEDFYAGIRDWSVEVTVSIGKDEMEDKKRADTQDMLTVLSQNAQIVPGAAQKAAQVSDILMNDLTPLVSPIQSNAVQPAAPAAPAEMGSPDATLQQ